MQNNGFDLFERGKMYDSAGNEYNITDIKNRKLL